MLFITLPEKRNNIVLIYQSTLNSKNFDSRTLEEVNTVTTTVSSFELISNRKP